MNMDIDSHFFTRRYGNGAVRSAFHIFRHENGHNTIELTHGEGSYTKMMDINDEDIVAIAAAMMKMQGGDVYQCKEDSDSEVK
jgi:hypothetical protein